MEDSMLQWFDTFLGLIVVLLAVSLIVMLLTQIIVAFLNLRGVNLKKGVVTLLKNSNIDELAENEIKEISKKALEHPLISDAWFGFKRLKLASTIRAEELKNILKHMSDDNNDWSDKLNNNIDEIEKRIDLWFDKIMDRVTQNFATQTRVWTIIFSIIIAMTLHLDVFRIFEQISNDAELRAGLVTSSNAILNHTEEALGSSNPVPEVFSESINTLKTQDSIVQVLPDPPSFRDQKEGADWLISNLSGHAKTDSLVEIYEDIVYSNFTGSIENLLARATTIKRELNNSKFALIPDPYPGWDYSPSKRHFWGVLAMAGLISLGAPFWFNALKTMSSLRPILANKEEKEREAQNKPDSANSRNG